MGAFPDWLARGRLNFIVPNSVDQWSVFRGSIGQAMGRTEAVFAKSFSREAAEAILSQAVLLHQSGAAGPARTLYEQVLKVWPGHSDALHLLGVLSAQTQDFKQSIRLIGKAIRIRPDPSYYSNRGIAYKAVNNLPRAVESYDRAIELDPKCVQAYSNRGNALQKAYELEAGDSGSKRARSIRTRLALSYSSHGEVLSGQNLLAEALASYDKAISLQPNFSCAWSNRGVVLMDLGRLEEALQSFETALSHDSQNIEAWSNRGLALNAMRRYAQALESFEMATQLNPRYVEAWSNRGIALHFLNRMEEALASFDRAIDLDGNHAEAFCNKGITLTALNRPQEALLSYDAAIAIHPKSASAHFNKALALLVMGDFQQGWKLYEWRWRLARAHLPDVSEPLWLGAESLADCTVLLHGEQGMGDVIQMSRFAKLVADRGAQVTLQVPHPLTDLLTSAPGVSRVVPSHTLLPACDFQVPLMSLPLALRTRLDSIPAQVPYLRVAKERLALWADRLGVQTLQRVGLVWSGDPVHPNDHNRSIAFCDLIRHLPEEFSYVCLQREVRDSDLDLLLEEPRVQFFGYQIEDFSDTAALCSLMDVVVTVDTSVAHLSGALGRPTWILLPFASDFRWLLNRNDSPWYPTVRLFRQKRIGSWEEPLRSVGHELLKLKPD